MCVGCEEGNVSVPDLGHTGPFLWKSPTGIDQSALSVFKNADEGAQAGSPVFLLIETFYWLVMHNKQHADIDPGFGPGHPSRKALDLPVVFLQPFIFYFNTIDIYFFLFFFFIFPYNTFNIYGYWERPNTGIFFITQVIFFLRSKKKSFVCGY